MNPNRMEEYRALMAELEAVPPELEYTLTRARARRSRRRAVTVPAASLAGMLAAFALAVNLSTPFALAVSRIPVLGDLARLVTLSPSLSAAVEHDYVQTVGQEQTVNGITLRVESLIADQKQLHVFFSLSSQQYDDLEGEAQLYLPDGQGELTGYALINSVFRQDNGQLQQFTADFNAGYDMPRALELEYAVWRTEDGGEGREVLARFRFPLTINADAVQNSKTFEVNQTLTLDGQTITVTTVEVYPTHMRLNLADHPENTAWLVGLDFYVTDGEGRRFDPVANGISASLDPDTPFYNQWRVESPWFYQARQLQVVITGVKWLDKGRERVEVNLADPAANQLSGGIVLAQAKRTGTSWDLKLQWPLVNEMSHSAMFRWTYYSPDGAEHTLTSMGMGMEHEAWNEQTQSWTEIDPVAYQTISLEDYPWDTVELCPAYTRCTVLEQPVTVSVE